MSANRHTPIRLCAGCATRDSQRAMDRFTVTGGRLVWVRDGGRGGYLHRRPECRDAFLTRKSYIRSLKTSVDRKDRAALLEQ